MKHNIKGILLLIAAVVAAAVLAACGNTAADNSSAASESPSSQTSSVASVDEELKSIFVVVRVDGKETSFRYSTDAEYLGEVLTAEKLVEGDDTEYGLMITTVNGVKADSGNREYWAIYVNGEYGQYGADSQPVADGDIFILALETY